MAWGSACFLGALAAGSACGVVHLLPASRGPQATCPPRTIRCPSPATCAPLEPYARDLRLSALPAPRAASLPQLVFQVEMSDLGWLGPAKNWIALGILAVVLVGIASERIHRMWCAMIGAGLMVSAPLQRSRVPAACDSRACLCQLRLPASW